MGGYEPTNHWMVPVKLACATWLKLTFRANGPLTLTLLRCGAFIYRPDKDGHLAVQINCVCADDGDVRFFSVIIWAIGRPWTVARSLTRFLNNNWPVHVMTDNPIKAGNEFMCHVSCDI